MNSQANSWFGAVWSTGDLPLVGGYRGHTSSRFKTQEHASQWLAVILESNRQEGRECDGETKPSTRAPELY